MGLLSVQGAAVDETMVVPELEQLRVAHTVTIVSEMFNNFRVRKAWSPLWTHTRVADTWCHRLQFLIQLVIEL